MPQVNFSITGLVVCYRKPNDGDFWTFVFPHDGIKHKVNFTYRKGGTTSRPESIRNKDVIISTNDSNAPAGSDSTFNKVLNIAASYLHGEGLKKKQPNKKLKIQHAELSSEAERSDRFVIAMQFNGSNQSPTATTLITDPVSSKIGGKIVIPNTGKVVITIGNKVIELSAGDRFDIDNFCGDCERDFLKYHTTHKNKGNDNKYCDVLSIKKFQLNDKGEPFLPEEEGEANRGKLTTGRRKPVNRGEPPAFCDGVRIDHNDLSDLD